MRKRIAQVLLALVGAVAATVGIGARPAAAENETVQGLIRNAGQPVAEVRISRDRAGRVHGNRPRRTPRAAG